MDTKRYIDSEKSNSWLDSFLTGTTIEEKQPIAEVKQEPEIDIDPDIEKEISLIQEAKLNTTIKEDVKKVVKVVEPKKSVAEGLTDFFNMIDSEKKTVKENVKKSEKKIVELEKLFDNLKKEKKKVKKKKKQLLVEPEKVKEEKQEINIVSLQNVEPKKDKPEDMIDRVQKEISEMKVANELEKLIKWLLLVAVVKHN